MIQKIKSKKWVLTIKAEGGSEWQQELMKTMLELYANLFYMDFLKKHKKNKIDWSLVEETDIKV